MPRFHHLTSATSLGPLRLSQPSARGNVERLTDSLYNHFHKISVGLSILRLLARRHIEGHKTPNQNISYWENIAMSQSTGTVTLHRVLKAPGDRIYNAFLDADAMAKWLPPHGFTGKVHHMDARVGGGYRMSFTNFGAGKSNFFTGTYVELKPGELIRYTNRFEDPNLPGEMSVTVTLKKVLCGTELHIVQAGIPPQIPVEFCYLGWQESLTLLAQLVEPEIPDSP